MIAKLLHRIKSRVAFRLAFLVISLSMVITLLTSLIQLKVAYQRDFESIQQYFESITPTQLNSLSRAVWTMDDTQIKAHLDGIIQARDIIFAAVMVDDKQQWASGFMDAEKTLDFNYELDHFHKNSKKKLGTLRIIASLDNLQARLKHNAWVILLTNSLQISLFAGCVLLLLQNTVTRHLEKLAAHVVNIDFQKKRPPIKLDRIKAGQEDEFFQVVSTLNVMQRRGYNAFKALGKSESRLRLFFDATEEGIFGINSEGRITFANSACLAKIGAHHSRGIIGKKVNKLFKYTSNSGEICGSEENIFLSPLQTAKSVVSDDGYFQVEGGPGFFAGVRVYPIKSEEYHSGTIVFFNDISEKREILREKNLLSQAIRQSPLLVIISNKIGKIEYVNPGFEQLTGYALKDVINRKAYFLGHSRKNRGVHRDIQASLRRSKKWQGIYYIKAKNGNEYCFELLVSPVFDKDGNIADLIFLCLDITQKVELQNQLLHAQKMEAVGRLAASFAHEFGNPLLGVRSVIKDISERLTMDGSDRYLLDLAYSECERMMVLIRDFQNFQAGSSDAKKHQDIHEVIDNVLIFYKKHIEKNNIILRKNYQDDLPALFINKNQIAQVFLNLIINAVDAMREIGGVLEICTHCRDGMVHIDIKDTGVGIDEIHKDLIFEPFYTTKSEIQGTGLGLSVSYGIVVGHGGEIVVSSLADKGSIFTVQLPLETYAN